LMRRFLITLLLLMAIDALAQDIIWHTPRRRVRAVGSAPTPPAWVEPGYSNTIIWYKFANPGTNAEGLIVDSSVIGTNIAVLGAGAALPTFTEQSNTVSASYYFVGGDTITNNYPTLYGDMSTGKIWTISCWVKLNTVNPNGGSIWEKWIGSGSYKGVGLYEYSGVLALGLRGGNSTYYYTTNGVVLSRYNYHHIMWCYNGSKADQWTYLNGKHRAVGVWNYSDLSDDVTNGVTARIGASVLGATYALDGWVSDLRIYTNFIPTQTQADMIFSNQFVYHGGQSVDPSDWSVWSNSIMYHTFEDNTYSYDQSPYRAGYDGGSGPGFTFSTINSNQFSHGGAEDYVDDDRYTLSYGAADKPFTAEAWLKFTNNLATPRYIFNKNTEYQIMTQFSKLICTLFSKGVSTNYIAYFSTETLPSNEWVYVSVTYDGTTNSLKMYTNGVALTPTNYLAGGGYVSMTNTANVLSVGAATVSQDMLRLSTQELSQAQIESRYNSTKGYFTP